MQKHLNAIMLTLCTATIEHFRSNIEETKSFINRLYYEREREKKQKGK